MILLTGVGVIYKVHMQQGVGSGHPKCVQLRAVQGYRGLCLMCMYRSLFMFWQHVCLMMSCIICRNLVFYPF